MTDTNERIGILMGSNSDWPVMQEAVNVCNRFGVDCDVRVISAHRTPEAATEYARTARDRGIRVLIAGAGAAAHLAGALAAQTTLPVIGIPISGSGSLGGLDALLATVQMPSGVPVATVGTDKAGNAALLAIQILAIADESLSDKLVKHKQGLVERVTNADSALRSSLRGGS